MEDVQELSSLSKRDTQGPSICLTAMPDRLIYDSLAPAQGNNVAQVNRQPNGGNEDKYDEGGYDQDLTPFYWCSTTLSGASGLSLSPTRSLGLTSPWSRKMP